MWSTAHPTRNEDAENHLQLNSSIHSCAGMIPVATENIQTTARKSASNESQRGSGAGTTGAPLSPGNPGQRPEASHGRTIEGLRQLTGVVRRRWCRIGFCCDDAVACVPSGLSGSNPHVFRCDHSHARVELTQILLCAFIARRMCSTPLDPQRDMCQRRRFLKILRATTARTISFDSTLSRE